MVTGLEKGRHSKRRGVIEVWLAVVINVCDTVATITTGGAMPEGSATLCMPVISAVGHTSLAIIGVKQKELLAEKVKTARTKPRSGPKANGKVVAKPDIRKECRIGTARILGWWRCGANRCC